MSDEAATGQSEEHADHGAHKLTLGRFIGTYVFSRDHKVIGKRSEERRGGDEGVSRSAPYH